MTWVFQAALRATVWAFIITKPYVSGITEQERFVFSAPHHSSILWSRSYCINRHVTCVWLCLFPRRGLIKAVDHTNPDNSGCVWVLIRLPELFTGGCSSWLRHTIIPSVRDVCANTRAAFINLQLLFTHINNIWFPLLFLVCLIPSYMQCKQTKSRKPVQQQSVKPVSDYCNWASDFEEMCDSWIWGNITDPGEKWVEKLT